MLETVFNPTLNANEIEGIVSPDAKNRRHICRRVDAEIDSLTACCF